MSKEGRLFQKEGVAPWSWPDRAVIDRRGVTGASVVGHNNVIPIVKQSEVIKKDLFLQTRLIVLY